MDAGVSGPGLVKGGCMRDILVVDNNPIIINFMRDRLQKAGYRVLAAENGLSALRLLESCIPDVIFIDLVMPNINGEKLCQIIRNSPELTGVYLVVISGIAREHEIDFDALGADAYIAKGPLHKFSENIFYVLDRLSTGEASELSRTVIGFEDLHEREITKELLSLGKHFEVILGNISDGILEISPEAKVVLANPAAVSLTGHSETQLLGENFIDLFAREPDRKRIAELLDPSQNNPCTDADGPFACNGRQLSLQVSAVNNIPDASLIVIMRDITETIRSQKAVEDSEKKYRTLYEESKRAEEVYRSLLNSSADAVAIYDLEGRTRYVSPAFTKIFGWTLADVRNRKMPFLPESEKEETLSIIQALVENGTPCHDFETKRYTRKGDLLDVSISASRYNDHNGKPSGILVTIRDVSEKKRLEAQLRYAQKMEAIGTLAGGIAHDFNNLLMGILGNISLVLMDMNESHPQYERIQSIENYIQSGSKLTKQLLGFARKGKYEVKPVNLNDVIRQTAEAFGRARKQITIHADLDENLSIVEADPGQLEQILLNLYLNAADAMPGGGELVIKTENITDPSIIEKPFHPKPGNYILLTLSDTGVGMDEKTMERIFDPFFTTKQMGRGTGLGMASVYGIVKGHNGFIDVQSTKGQGSTFTIYLPATSATDRLTVQRKETDGSIALQSGTILIIDDEEMILDVGTRMLRKLGFTVLSVDNGKDAIKIYQDHKNHIDLIILDMVMPGMNGGDVYDFVKQIKPDAKVILSSGYSMDGSAKEIIDRGCDGFIQKPFNMLQLSTKIYEVRNSA